MRRRNEVLVGGSILAALATVAAGIVWLGEVQLSGPRRLEEARFRSVGGLGVGDPVTLRGVKVGRVDAIRLAGDDWVAVELRIDREVELPGDPAAVVTPSTLFGEWAVTVVSRSAPFDDPSVPAQFAEAEQVHGDAAWPGAAQIDISQLTAKAGQIAGDLATLSGRVESVFDSAMAERLRTSVGELAELASDLQEFVRRQQGKVERTALSAERGAGALAEAAADLEAAAARLDSATGDRQLQDILESGRSSAGDLRAASADIRSLTRAVSEQQGSVIRTIVATDSLLTRLAEGRGTLGLLAQDSALYHETTLTVRELRKLLADVQANPRKYFKFSVF
jgi:phospholipid/cholesterol/gamma-HCH transport system substrate-binding protein